MRQKKEVMKKIQTEAGGQSRDESTVVKRRSRVL